MAERWIDTAEADTEDSDATTCEDLGYGQDDSWNEVTVVPESQSLLRGEDVDPAADPVVVVRRRGNGWGLERGVSPLPPSDVMEESCAHSEDLEGSPLLQRDVGFEDQFFERPRFPHSPIGERRPHLLSPPGATPAVQIPAVINQYLRGYQREGVAFLHICYCSNTGGLLCDDMGLGKTVQVIAFMCAVLGKTGTRVDTLLTGPRQTCSGGCFLVVSPTSVLYNWTSELETWSHLKYGVYHRDKKEETIDKARRRKLEVVMTTHDTARAYIDELNTVDWLAVICDEVQAIKGTQSQVTAAMNSLRARRRFGLTGTALQNNLTELWCLLNWANPGCLGTLTDFQRDFERPILQGQKYDCTKRQLAQGRQKQAELEDLMKKWVLRRTKAIIASQLPKKDEFVVFCPLTELQESVYRALLECEDVQLILHARKPCDCYSGETRGDCCYRENSEGQRWSNLAWEYIPLLTKVANHLGLLMPERTGSERQKEKGTRVCDVVFSVLPQFKDIHSGARFLTLSDPKYCGKMKVLEKLLSKFHEERAKVIVFSFSVQLLGIVQDYLVSRGYEHCRLDGSTKIEDRTQIVNTFNTDPTQFVFLISKKCGGVGLNITGANRVIIFDPSWNPATDLQAEDRAFRIGQSRDVRVYRFVTEGTVEEMIYLRQVYKQQLSNMTMEGSRERRYFTAVAGDRNQKGELFGYSNLLQLRQPGSSITMDILKRVDQMEAGLKMAPDLTRSEGAAAEAACDIKEAILPGATTLVHSGRKSVVGNSKVEEHISRQAIADVLQLQQHSQDPANITEHRLEEFSEESDDVDYQAPPPTKKLGRSSPSSPDNARSPSSICQLNRGTKHKATGTEGHQDTDAKKKAVRHEQFERMASKFGYTSHYDFALHVKEASKEERQEMLDEFYEVQHQKKSSKVPPNRKVRTSSRQLSKRKYSHRPTLEFEDAPFEKGTHKSRPPNLARSHDTGEPKLVSRTSDSVNRVHIPETDSNPPTNTECRSAGAKFDCSSSGKHQGMTPGYGAGSLLDELFEPTVSSLTLHPAHGGYTVARQQTESSPMLNLVPTSCAQKSVCAESSINIDELFG